MLLNKKAVKSHVLNRWAKLRPGKEMTRVGSETYSELNARLTNLIDKLIHEHPSVGKTIILK